MLATNGIEDATVYGMALVTQGLTVLGAIDGIGLESRGLLWACPAIWTNSQSSLATTWIDAASAVTTTWSASSPAITTTWVSPSGEPYAEC